MFRAVEAEGSDWELAVMGVSCRQRQEQGTDRHLVEILS